MAERCTSDCPITDCQWIFDRIRVMPLIQGGTRVEWTLHPQFRDPNPHTFQLQVGHTGNNLATDWVDVGVPADDTFYLIDDLQRVHGMTQWTHYRILVTTPLGTYTSRPQHALGDLDRVSWRRIKEIERRETVMFKQGRTGSEGYLLKRMLFGEPCPEGHIDPLTQENTNPDCLTCMGTGFLNGYYDPVPCVWAAPERVTRREHLDAGEMRGSINDIVVPARMLAIPLLDEEDVWVDRKSDLRWYIHQITNLVEVQGVPVVVQAEQRLAPFTDNIYKIVIAGQVPG